MQNKLKLWFGSYNEKYKDEKAAFFSTKNIPLANDLEQNYGKIYDELKILWNPNGPDNISTYRDYSAYDELQFPPNSWKKLVFMVWGVKNKFVCDKFPIVSVLLSQYPLITSCMVTKLSPKSIVAGHCGITNAQYRIHLGLKVPPGTVEQCGMEVGQQKEKWENGKTTAFVDAHYHHVWNNLDDDRYVLIIDILRPEFQGRQGFICARVIISQIYMMLARKTGINYLYKVPATSLLDILAYIAYVPLWCAIYLNNKIGFLKL